MFSFMNKQLTFEINKLAYHFDHQMNTQFFMHLSNTKRWECKALREWNVNLCKCDIFVVVSQV